MKFRFSTTIFTITVASLAFSSETWVETAYTETDTPVVASLTVFPGETTETAEGIWSINVSRTILKKNPIGAVTEFPAWVADLTPITYENQTKSCVENNIVAPNGITPRMAYTRYDFFQQFRLYENGTPVREFVSRTGQSNKLFSVYYLVNP